jgi:hypothetical protein
MQAEAAWQTTAELRHILGFGETLFLRAVAELLTADGGGALPEATGRFLEKLENPCADIDNNARPFVA